MGSELPETEESYCTSDDGQYQCNTAIHTRKAGRRRKKPKVIERPVGQALAILVRHCFPDFWQRLNAIEDPRDTDRVIYGIKQVLCLAVLMFSCRITSLRGLDRISDNVMFCDNLYRFSGQKTQTVMVSQQLVNVLKELNSDELASVQPQLVRQLIVKKRLPDAYVLGYIALASDGTGIFSSSDYHCEQCLTQNHKDGTVTYMHNMLETKVLCADGMALSLMSEPIENLSDRNYNKQDCENKAFKRMLPRLKETFPRQPFVHLLDSLYAQAPIFKLILNAKHQFICNFKSGSIPTLYNEAMELLKLNTGNKLTVKIMTGKKSYVYQTLRWLDNLEYKGMTLGFVLCEETDKNGDVKIFVWLTSFNVTKKNVQEIARAGRMRWKIENEGFKEQKCGYEMEHFCNCKNPNTMFSLYLILQIAHMFMQLLARSNLLDEPVKALKYLAFKLLESLRNSLLTAVAPYQKLPTMQIRFTKGET